MKVHEGIIHQRGHSFSTPVQVGGGGEGYLRESPFPEVHSFLTRVPAISGTRQDAPPGRYKSERCVVSCIDCRRPSAVLCLREFSTARRRRRVTERGGNPFYIVVDAELFSSRNPLLSANQHVAMHPYCPIIETTRHRSTENGKRNPDLHAQVYTMECGPATVDIPGCVDIRTSRANVDEGQRLAMEAKSGRAEMGRNVSRRN
ncbi:hypothetical protein ALC56_12885 [Trachymyrmex septentrionalis]|uniref:Uncharacterized protein n=1 Tax=Trachymyrmex septentrionalis TaxID=34720 RepID=A0A195EX13_9HYME|nr:hypothetical protein ALC56_12885 [Trachymyrmex septentrionalis]